MSPTSPSSPSSPTMSAYESKQDNRQDMTSVLLDALTTLKKRELANKAPFKARAYGTVLQQIQQLPSPIYSMDDLAIIKGMGEKIREYKKSPHFLLCKVPSNMRLIQSN